MRRAVVGPAVCLDLRDAGDALAGAVHAHEPCSDEAAGGRQHGPAEQALELGGRAQEYSPARSSGTIQPKRVKKSGMSDVR
jgi:hypothetical protein